MAIPDLYQEPAPFQLVQGVIANTVTAAGQNLYVIIPSYDQVTRWGPCPWTPHVGPAYPQQGGQCLVGMGEDGWSGLKWVLAWS